jgi:hypothetical protein
LAVMVIMTTVMVVVMVMVGDAKEKRGEEMV